jgi:hypothetical protein
VLTWIMVDLHIFSTSWHSNVVNFNDLPETFTFGGRIMEVGGIYFKRDLRRHVNSGEQTIHRLRHCASESFQPLGLAMI